MSETLQIVIASAVLNAGVTWGTIRISLAWLRRDVDDLKERFDDLPCLKPQAPRPSSC